MSVMTFRQGTVEDLVALNARSEGERIEPRGESWATFCVDEAPAAMWGILLRYPHVGELAGIVTDAIRGRHALQFMRWSKRLLHEAAYDFRLRRLTAYVQAEKLEYRRFAEAFHFEPESIMAQAGPDGGDLIVYARMYPWEAWQAGCSAEEGVMTGPHSRPQLRQLLHLQTMAACGRTTADGPVRRVNGTRLM